MVMPSCKGSWFGQVDVSATGQAVIVDLQWLEFLDASVVSTLLTARGYGRDHHVRVEVAGARGRVAALLGVLGLAEALSMCADVYEAVCILLDHGLPQPAGARHTSPIPSRPGTREGFPSLGWGLSRRDPLAARGRA